MKWINDSAFVNALHLNDTHNMRFMHAVMHVQRIVALFISMEGPASDATWRDERNAIDGNWAFQATYTIAMFLNINIDIWCSMEKLLSKQTIVCDSENCLVFRIWQKIRKLMIYEHMSTTQTYPSTHLSSQIFGSTVSTQIRDVRELLIDEKIRRRNAVE